MYAVCAGSPLDREKDWLEKGVKGTVSTRTAALYRETQHRVTEEVLKLPPMHRVVRHFHIRLRPADASEYMGEWEVMRRLRVQMNADARGRGALLIALLAKLQKLRQLIVSPRLYAEGASNARGDAASAIAAGGSGFLDALASLVAEIAPRHPRFVIVAESVGILQVCVALVRAAVPLEWHGTYDGSLSGQRRDALVKAFLGCKSGVLGLSLKAGGVGLNLVPGVTAMVMLSQSFSPADTRQVEKRIHRCGQTSEVSIYHLLARGSPDWALTKVHEDKLALEAGVVNDDWSGVSADKCWRQAGRIADLCAAVDPATGNLIESSEPPPPRQGGAAKADAAAAAGSSSGGSGSGSRGGGGAAAAAAQQQQQARVRVPAVAPPPAPPARVVPSRFFPVAVDDGDDDDDDALVGLLPSQQQPPQAPPTPFAPPFAAAKPPCRFGASCYQTNPVHLAQYSHPARQQPLPPCKYGARCYQTNPAHLARYSHPPRSKRDEPEGGF